MREGGWVGVGGWRQEEWSHLPHLSHWSPHHSLWSPTIRSLISYMTWPVVTLLLGWPSHGGTPKIHAHIWGSPTEDFHDSKKLSTTDHRGFLPFYLFNMDSIRTWMARGILQPHTQQTTKLILITIWEGKTKQALLCFNPLRFVRPLMRFSSRKAIIFPIPPQCPCNLHN